MPKKRAARESPLSEFSTLFKHFDDARDPIYLIDQGQTALWSNAAAQRLFNLIAEVPKAPIGACLPLFLKAWLGKAAANKQICEEPISLNLKDGSLMRLYPHDIDISSSDPGSELRLISLQASPIKSEDLERSQYLATVAHDLKNPMGAIFGYADALLDTPTGEGLSPVQRDILSRIRATATRSIDLVRNYQLMSDLRSRPSIRPTHPVDLNQVINLVVESTWRDDAMNPEIVLKLQKPAMPLWVDRVSLERLCSNLLVNALKFTPSSGKISIQTSTQGHNTILKFHNTGSYIPRAEHTKIFERYGRADAATKTPGTGLGLYIVKSIVEAAGGNISLESTVEDGTAFIVSLPSA